MNSVWVSFDITLSYLMHITCDTPAFKNTQPFYSEWHDATIAIFILKFSLSSSFFNLSELNKYVDPIWFSFSKHNKSPLFLYLKSSILLSFSPCPEKCSIKVPSLKTFYRFGKVPQTFWILILTLAWIKDYFKISHSSLKLISSLIGLFKQEKGEANINVMCILL